MTWTLSQLWLGSNTVRRCKQEILGFFILSYVFGHILFSCAAISHTVRRLIDPDLHVYTESTDLELTQVNCVMRIISGLGFTTLICSSENLQW